MSQRDHGSAAHYPSTGHLAFVRKGVLMAAHFDPERLVLTAHPVPVVEGVSQALNLWARFLTSGAAQLAASDGGLLVCAPGGIHERPPANLLKRVPIP